MILRQHSRVAMFSSSPLLLSILCLSVVFVPWGGTAAALSPSPREIADLIVPEVMASMGKPSHVNFGTWSYEGGNIVRGLWEIQNTFPDMDIEAFLHQHLNHFQVRNLGRFLPHPPKSSVQICSFSQYINVESERTMHVKILKKSSASPFDH